MADRGSLHPDPFEYGLASYGGSSFSELLRRLPGNVTPGDWVPQTHQGGRMPEHAEGTTIVAAVYGEGVIIAGDRRATAGNIIARRDMRKIFQTDRLSAVGISGSAGPAIELAKVFATELEHYEKVEGSELSLEGKANKLASMVRGNLPMAMQGLVVVPLFAGFDERASRGKIFDFDAVGGRYEETRFSSTGSGGMHARASLKARWEPGLDGATAVDLCVAALWDAADEDSATGGPDPVRGVYPIVARISSAGYEEIGADVIAERAAEVAAARGDRLSLDGDGAGSPRPNAGP